MIFEKMRQLELIYNSFPTDASALFAYIKENIHAEKYINDETIQKCIDVQRRGKRLALGKFVDEDRIIACLVIDHYLSLDICTTWYDAAHSWSYFNHSYQFVDMLTTYYTSTIIKYLDDIVDYQKELNKYDPEIFHRGDKYLVKVNYRAYGIQFNSIIGVDKLTKENLKKVKLAIDDAEIFLLNLRAFIGEIESFISNVMRFLGDDYEVKISDDSYTIILKEDAESRYVVGKRLCFYINFRFFTDSNFSREKAISLVAYTINVKVKCPGISRSNIAVILDKMVRMEDFRSIYDVNFYDLDELYDVVKRTHDSNFKHVEILDWEVN